MATYATTDDLISWIGDAADVAYLTDSAGDDPDADVLDTILSRAQGEIDKYLSRRYSVPVDVSSDTNLASSLKGILLDVASYYLHSRGNQITSEKKAAYDSAISWCRDIAQGAGNLPAAATPSSQTSNKPHIRTSNSDRVFNRSNTGSF